MKMQTEPSIAIIIVSVTTGVSPGAVVIFLVVAALGYFGVLQQLLAASWLLGAIIVVATFFSGTQREYSQKSPNEKRLSAAHPALPERAGAAGGG